MFNGLKRNAMTNMSRDMRETSVTDFFTLPTLGRVHQCLDPIMPQNWSGPDPGGNETYACQHHV